MLANSKYLSHINKYIVNSTSPQEYTAIRKVNSDDSIAWMTSLNSHPTQPNLSIDLSESNVYLVVYSSFLQVVQLKSTDGSVESWINL